MDGQYSSDVTDDQWQIIERLLPRRCAVGRPRTVPRRRIVDAILYVVRAGCQWRQLPRDFPKMGNGVRRVLAVATARHLAGDPRPAA